MFAKIISVGLFGMEAYMTGVEADISGGMPRFDVVGLPDTAVSESRERVRSAIKNNGFDFPPSRITINLAPADIKKEGPIYDLPILIAILKSTGQLSCDTDSSAFLGELSLNGEVRRINGVLPMVIKAQRCGVKEIYIPAPNAAEGAVVRGITVYPVRNVGQLLSHLTGGEKITPVSESDFKSYSLPDNLPDFSDVKGQHEAKRALEVAAAGGHNVMMIGPPGSGKSMLAKRIPSILPDMTFEEMIETTKIHSIAGLLDKNGLVRTRPFRSPHHTVTAVGLGGGGTGTVRPGEVSLAHNGVLFLDELPEFSRMSLEVLRQPIEDGKITISRSHGSYTYPCNIMLVAAMNPCPCGYFNDPSGKCTCTPQKIHNYLNKISGPLLDRFDIHIEVSAVKFDELRDKEQTEPSAEIKKRVDKARKIQSERYKGTSTSCNANINAEQFEKVCIIDDEAEQMLKSAFESMGMTARAYDRVLKVARTIADLDNSEIIKSDHILEAVQYRSLDRIGENDFRL